MKHYRVEFLPTAQQDIHNSYEWGVDVWGKEQTQRWLREFYATCKERLRLFPEAFPIAPESEDLGRELRHLIIDRYRVIFIVNDNVVTVLYVRGSYVRPITVDEEDT